MEHALSVIGWPMLQVGLSTIVALSPLLFKQSYLALVFLKTIVVVVLLGMFSNDQRIYRIIDFT